jgi:hypothetical protein
MRSRAMRADRIVERADGAGELGRVGDDVKAWPALNLVTETTSEATGSRLREAIVCRAATIWLAATIGSTVSCGMAAWPPLPVTLTVNSAVAAMIAPGRSAKWPTGLPGRLCMPKTRSMPKRSISPS